MSRRNRAPKRQILPDPKFKDQQLAKFINQIMVDGKKSIAEKIVYKALDLISDVSKTTEPLASFGQAIEKLRPTVEVKSRRVGGATYPVPVEVRPVRQETLAMRWLITAARSRNEKTMHERLGRELLDVLEDRGGAVRKRGEVYRMAEANRAFSHYRF